MLFTQLKSKENTQQQNKVAVDGGRWVGLASPKPSAVQERGRPEVQFVGQLGVDASLQGTTMGDRSAMVCVGL